MNRKRNIPFRKLIMGDRIQARLILDGRIVADFISDRIADMTELLNAIRFRTRELRGLARLYVRNLTRGWSEDRPLMLYTTVGATAARRSQVAAVTTCGVSPSPAPAPWLNYI